MAGSTLIGALRVVLGINTAAFDKGLSLSQKKMAAAGRDFARIGKRMQRVGQSLSTQLTLPVLALGAGVLKVAGDFESAMNRVEAATGAAGKELKALRDQAKAFGADKSFTATATETAQVMEMLAKNGLSVSQILGGATESTLKLAAATGSEFSPAADLATDVIQQFSKQAADLNDVVDKVTGALIVSKFGFDDYKLAIGQAGGVAGGLGLSFEDLNVAIAATSALFASGSDAGTSFKTFLTRLVPQSDQAAALMEKLGLKFFDASGKMKPLAEIAEVLRQKLGGLADEAKTDVLKQVFGTDAMRTAIGLMNQGAEGLARVNAEINKADAQKQMEARMKGLNGGLTQLKKSAESLAIALGDSGFLTAAANFVSAITDMIRAVAQLPPGILKAIGVLAGFAAAVGPVLFVAGKLIGVWGSFLTLGGRLPAVFAKSGAEAAGVAAKTGLAARAFGGLQKAMLFLRGPWGIAIMAIAAAIGILAMRSKQATVASEEHRKRQEQLSEAQARLREITEKLATATGEEAKAARIAAAEATRKAMADVRAAKAALERAKAELILARALAAKANADVRQSTRTVLGAGGGFDPTRGKIRMAEKPNARAAQEEADFKAALANLVTATSNLNELSTALQAPINVALPKDNPDLSTDSSKKARDDSEQRLKEFLRLKYEMEQEELDGKRELLEAQRDISYSIEERAGLARQILEIEKQQRSKQIGFDLAMTLADKTVSAQQKEEAKTRAAKQLALNDQVSALRLQAINDDEAAARQRAEEQLAQTRYDLQRGRLEAERNLAQTAAERRAIELEILELAYRERRERLERIIRESRDADERHKASMELNALGGQQALDRQGVLQSTMGPWESFMQSLPNTAAKARESMEALKVQGIHGVIDSLVALRHGFGAFRDTALRALDDLIANLLRVELMKGASKLFGGAPAQEAAQGAQLATAGTTLMTAGGTLNAAGGTLTAAGGTLTGASAALAPAGITLNTASASLTASAAMWAATAAQIMVAASMLMAANGASAAAGAPGGVPAFDTGGAFQVLGRHGRDRNTLALNGMQIAKVSYGEKLSISNDKQAAGAAMPGAFHFHFPGALSDREARRTGTQAAAGFRAEMARAATKGVS